MQYKVVLFDVDDTLLALESGNVWPRMFHQVMTEIGAEDTPENYQKFLDHNHELWQSAENGEIKTSDVFDRRFDLAFTRKTGVPAAEIDKKFQTLQIKEVTPTPGAEICCEKLVASGAKLYAATNGKQSTQEQRIQTSVLAPYITKVFSSDGIGETKPNKGFFDGILAELGVTDKREVMMVGDTYGEDILGANQYGIDSCWINLKNAPLPEKPLYTYVVPTLESLPKDLGL